MIRIFPTLAVSFILLAGFSPVLAGHHKAGMIHAKAKPPEEVVAERKAAKEKKLRLEERAPIAQPGKIVVVYKFKCAGFARQQDAMRALNAMIQHEREAAPVTYASSPLVFEDGDIGAVDQHRSIGSYNEAVKWQGANAVWQAHLNDILNSCEISSDDIQTTVAQVQ